MTERDPPTKCRGTWRRIVFLFLATGMLACTFLPPLLTGILGQAYSDPRSRFTPWVFEDMMKESFTLPTFLVGGGFGLALLIFSVVCAAVGDSRRAERGLVLFVVWLFFWLGILSALSRARP